MSSPPEIQAYRFGRIVIDEKAYDQDVIIFPDRVRPNWRRIDGHSLALEDLDEVLENEPEVIILGQGVFGRMKVPDRVRKSIAGRRIELLIYKTDRACEAYNELRAQRRVIAALHLSC